MSDPSPSNNAQPQSPNDGSPSRSPRLPSDIQLPVINKRSSMDRQTAESPGKINETSEQSPDGSSKPRPSILKKPTDDNMSRQQEWELIIQPVDGSPPPQLEDDPGNPESPPHSSTKLGCPECCPDADDDLVPDMNRSDAGKPDAANTEFVYYSATLREVAPRLTSDVDRQGVILWLRKLFRPEYHSSRFRTKRNKFLLYLTLTLMNDELFGIFRENPPAGALPTFESLEEPPITPAEWENDTMWHDVLVGVPRTHEKMECAVHVATCQCETDTFNGTLLDEEFTYLLYLARPFAALLPNTEDRTKIAAWLQTLCTIRQNSCSAMKYIRNDYITALLGYIHELRVAGPFSEFPTWDPLPPLAEAARILSESYPHIDPCQSNVDEFFGSQPVPDEGAFCFLAVTGEMIESSMENIN